MARKNDEDKRIRFLEDQVRELKATKRSLLKQLKKINKGYRKIRDEESEEIEPANIDTNYITCPECFSPITSHELMGRHWDYCKKCDWRSGVTVK